MDSIHVAQDTGFLDFFGCFNGIHYRVSRGSIHRLAKKEGIELQPTLSKLTGEKQEEALALLKQGVSLRQVAKRLEVNHETLRRLVKRLEDEQE